MKDEPPPRRKSLPHFPGVERHNTAVVHFVTVCTKERQPLLASKPIHELLKRAWSPIDFFQVGKYVIMPDHVHLFCTPTQPNSGYLKAWMTYWKSFTSRHWPGKKPGHIWQRDFWDTQLRHGEIYESKWDYVRLNPVRKGLVKSSEDWAYQGEMNPIEWHD